MPKIPGAETFLGDQHHSSKHPGPEACKGKKAVVLGSNNSAHDSCAALWENDVDVTMVPRSSTHLWGLGSDTPKDPGPWEGELRNLWKPTQEPHLWIHGGNLHQSRHHPQFLSLQLKARLPGIPTPVYQLAPVHHLR